MATHSIGSAGGRDYPTWQAWHDALSATLTADEIGEGYNDSEFSVAGTVLNVGSHTTGSFRIIARAHSGQGFRDNPNVRTNALAYNQTNGVALKKSSSYGNVIIINSNQSITIENLQVFSGSGGTGINALNGGAVNALLKDIIVNVAGTNGWRIQADGGSNNGLAVNVFVHRRATGGNGAEISTGAKAIGCCVVFPSDLGPGGTGFTGTNTGNIIQSCLILGFSTAVTAAAFDTMNSKNNGTNLSSGLPGSGNQHSLTFNSSTPLTNGTSANMDGRTVSGTALDSNGFLDSTNAPNDISAQARASSPRIGHWEPVGGGGATNKGFRSLLGVGL